MILSNRQEYAIQQDESVAIYEQKYGLRGEDEKQRATNELLRKRQFEATI